MKRFIDYVNAAKTEYTYLVKLAVDDVDDDMLDKIEDVFAANELASASKFKSTPIQKHPLDFVGVINSRVFTTIVTTKYPSLVFDLRLALSDALKVPMSHILVTTPDSPREIEAELYLKKMDAKKEDYKPVIGDDYYSESFTTEEAKLIAGQEQIDSMLGDLAKVAKERKVHMADPSLLSPVATDGSDPEIGDEPKVNDKFSLFGRPMRKK